MRCASPWTTAVLPTPGSPIRAGVFFWRRERICMIRSISVSRAMAASSLASAAEMCERTAGRRVQLGLGGELGGVAADLVEQLRGLLALALGAGSRAGAALASAGAGEHADDLVADLLRVGVEVEQDAGGDALVLADEAEQDVLGADVVVAKAQGLAQGELEHLLGARGEGDLAGGDLLARPDDADNLSADALDGDVEGLEDAGGQALLLAQQAEEDVLGADVIVLENPGLLLGEDDHLASPFGEALKHAVLSYLSGTTWGGVTRSFPLDRHLRRSPERCTRSPARCDNSTNG